MAFLETSCLHDLTFTTLTLGILVITILTVTISFTIPKPLCEHYIMGPFFLILQSLLIPYLQPHQLPVSTSILLLTIMFSQLYSMFRNTDTKKKKTQHIKNCFKPTWFALRHWFYQLLGYSFISTSNLTMKCYHLTVSFSYKIIGHIVT